MSLEAKKEVMHIVKKRLRPVFDKGTINEQDYTRINRTVCRSLYDRIGTTGSLTDATKAHWGDVAAKEVKSALQDLKAKENA
jgi:hypothetical protein